MMINSVVIIGMIGLLLISNVLWYSQGFKDGRREGWHKARNLGRSLADK
jgi:hypothetical protein